MRLFTPGEAWTVTTAQHGLRVVPYDSDLLYEFMDLEYRVVGKDGVQVDYMKYDLEVLDPIRGRKCPATGTREWPVRRDRYDIRFVYVNLKAGTSEPAEWVRRGPTCPLRRRSRCLSASCASYARTWR